MDLTEPADHLAENCFDHSGINGGGADHVLRYAARPASLVAMLRRTVERDPNHESIVEVGASG